MTQAARQDVERAVPSVLQVLARRARYLLGDPSLQEIRRAVLAEGTPDTALWDALHRWAQADSRPLVLLIDEIDALEGDTLLSVLRRVREPAGRVPAQHSAVRRARRAGLSDSLTHDRPAGRCRQPIQYQRRVVADGRFRPRGSGGFARPAHGRNRPAL